MRKALLSSDNPKCYKGYSRDWLTKWVTEHASNLFKFNIETIFITHRKLNYYFENIRQKKVQFSKYILKRGRAYNIQ